jgi:hypothetical protein
MKIRKATAYFATHPIAKPFALVMAMSVAVRVVGLGFPPNVYNDTEHYVSLARQLATLQLAGYVGFSTPVYPLFLALAGLNFQAVQIMQYILGIAISGMLFTMVYRRTRSSFAALIAGIIFCLSVAELAFEQAILTETMATFMIVASAMKLQGILGNHDLSIVRYATLGALTGLTGLTRPLYAFLAPLYLIFLALTSRRSPRRSWQLFAFASCAGALLLGWSFVNWLNVGYFAVSTQMGFGLSNHSGAFIELAPDQYAAIRDPYLRARSEQIAETGTHANTIYRVWDQLQRETGYDRIRLLREITAMSLQLFAAHPMLYARSVALAWVRFWHPPLYEGMPFLGGHLHNIYHGPQILAQIAQLAGTIQWRQTALVEALNLMFCFCAAAKAWQLLKRKSSLDFDAIAIATVMASSIVQAMLEFGSGDRYSIPTFPLVIYAVVSAITGIIGRRPRAIVKAMP